MTSMTSNVRVSMPSHTTIHRKTDSDQAVAKVRGGTRSRGLQLVLTTALYVCDGYPWSLMYRSAIKDGQKTAGGEGFE